MTYWQRRQPEQAKVGQRLARQARADVTRIAAVGVRRIILFGSLARRRFAPGSDIDLTVEGLAKADLFAALARVNELSQFWVDLKPLEELEPRFRVFTRPAHPVARKCPGMLARGLEPHAGGDLTPRPPSL